MGTRNLTKVIDRNGVTKVAQYGQWDGYPSGQGATALYHAQNHRLIESKLDKLTFLTDSEIENINSLLSASGQPVSEVYPTLSRDTCADILGYVAYGNDVFLVDNSDFENDELFCEAVYTLDFQQKKFISVYGGTTTEHNLDDLPTLEEYLNEWATINDPGVVG
jgi:hypothetical protein